MEFRWGRLFLGQGFILREMFYTVNRIVPTQNTKQKTWLFGKKKACTLAALTPAVHRALLPMSAEVGFQFKSTIFFVNKSKKIPTITQFPLFDILVGLSSCCPLDNKKRCLKSPKKLSSPR